MVFDAGILSTLFFKGNELLISPALSLFSQIVLYQGLIFYEMEFLLYRLQPFLFPQGLGGLAVNPNGKGKGIYERMDFFDIMLIIDFMSFLSVLFFVWIYLVAALYPTKNIKILFQLESQDTKTKDFLESEVFIRNTVIQICSYICLSIMFLLMCVWDER